VEDLGERESVLLLTSLRERGPESGGSASISLGDGGASERYSEARRLAYEELSSDENNHGGLGGRSGLGVHGRHSVLDLLERQAL
jgi:hypothetical protein